MAFLPESIWKRAYDSIFTKTWSTMTILSCNGKIVKLSKGLSSSAYGTTPVIQLQDKNLECLQELPLTLRSFVLYF